MNEHSTIDSIIGACKYCKKKSAERLETRVMGLFLLLILIQVAIIAIGIFEK